MTYAWLVIVLKTGQNVVRGPLNSFLVTWSLKGLIQFHEKGWRFTGAYQEHFERTRTPDKLELGQKCYGGGNYWDPIIGENTY